MEDDLRHTVWLVQISIEKEEKNKHLIYVPIGREGRNIFYKYWFLHDWQVFEWENSIF